MSLITRMVKGTCVYFSRTSNDGFGGSTFADGVEIDCRWEDVQTLFVNELGVEIMSKSTVYVPQDMIPGDYLYNGELSEITPSDNPQEIDGAKEIGGFDKLPNFRYTEFLRTAFLI